MNNLLNCMYHVYDKDTIILLLKKLGYIFYELETSAANNIELSRKH